MAHSLAVPRRNGDDQSSTNPFPSGTSEYGLAGWITATPSLRHLFTTRGLAVGHDGGFMIDNVCQQALTEIDWIARHRRRVQFMRDNPNRPFPES
ncbi:MAG: hypothetical protein OEY03_08655 [Rhizobacter sp.]|nr:hypothetical protein [Rhizobacter sp.]